MTMVAGKILYEDGEFFIGTDAAHIYEKANEITQRIMSRNLNLINTIFCML